jgi:serine/threonine-protein kinase RIO1
MGRIRQILAGITKPLRPDATACDAYVFTFLKLFVVKWYKNAEQIRYLNKHLAPQYSDKPKRIAPVAWHEWKAIKKLYKYGISPKPIFLGHNYIIMEHAGTNLQDIERWEERDDYRTQMWKIIEIMNDIGFKHNDLIPRNVCVKKDKLVLIDFTMSEFDGVSILEGIPNPIWAQPDDERILDSFRTNKAIC